MNLDSIDHRILRELQRDAARPVEDLGDTIGLSRNATWRRIKRLEDDGIITARVAKVDPAALDLNLAVFISVRTDRHDAKWAEEFRRVMRLFPEVLGAYRTSGRP